MNFENCARDAIAFGIAMRHAGYHLFVMGPTGSGKRTLARQAIADHGARNGTHRSDWVYVHNFAQPHQPIALELPAGRGAKLRSDMRALVDDLRATIPAAYESEEYASALEKLNDEYKKRAERALGEVGDEAQRQGLATVRTAAGFSFAAQKRGDVMSSQDFDALPPEERTRLSGAVEQLHERLVHVLRDSMRQRKEYADRLRALNRSTTLIAVEHTVDEIKARYADLLAAIDYFDVVRTSVIENADAFRADEAAEAARQAGALGLYEINLLVDASDEGGAPIVEADLLSYQNLVGRIDHIARFGTLLTDFRHIKPGLLHRANGEYLVVDAVRLLTQPFAWGALKRALMRREVRIEPTVEMFSTISTIQLEPRPIPLELKVVLIGERRGLRLAAGARPGVRPAVSRRRRPRRRPVAHGRAAERTRKHARRAGAFAGIAAARRAGAGAVDRPRRTARRRRHAGQRRRGTAARRAARGRPHRAPGGARFDRVRRRGRRPGGTSRAPAAPTSDCARRPCAAC